MDNNKYSIISTILYYCYFTLVWLLPSAVSANSITERLTEALSFSDPAVENNILAPEVAFKVKLEQYSKTQLKLSWQAEENYYLYKDKFVIQAITTANSISNIAFPAGVLKDDPEFGRVEVYYNQNHALMQFNVADQSLTPIEVALTYQGCKENTICYPPIKKIIPVAIDFNKVTPPAEAMVINKKLSAQDSITQKLKDSNLIVNIIAFFGFGLLLSLTPCIFPMVPILSGIIVGQGKHIKRSKAVALSLAYIIAMAAGYAALGIIAGLFDFNLQAASQNIIVLSLFSGIFVLLALSMFGFYQLQLPSSLQSKLLANQSYFKTGTLTNAATMGTLSAIIVSPCVAPPLAGALLFISQTNDALLGGLALFAFGIGLGMPLLVVGAGVGSLLPHAGAWMETIKRCFGVMMLGVAIWIIARVLPTAVALILWAALFIITAIFIGALDRIESITTNAQRFSKGIGILLLVYGIALVIGAASGGGTVLRPLDKLLAANPAAQKLLPFHAVSNIKALEQELQQASSATKPVMLYFYADWCAICKELEADTYPDPLVQNALQTFTLLKVDVTENNAADKALLKQFKLYAPPAILFFDNKQEVQSHRLIGFIDARDFAKHIDEVLVLAL